MTGTGTEGLGLGGTLRLTWVPDRLAHVIDTCTADDTSTAWESGGTWTGLARQEVSYLRRSPCLSRRSLTASGCWALTTRPQKWCV